LVIGSEGFIGSNLVNYYIKRNEDIYGADLLEVGSQQYNYFKISRLSPEFDELLQQTKFDVCINAAGSGNVPYSMTHPVTDFEANSLDTMRLLDGIRRYQSSCRYIHISSAAVYGNPARLPVTEQDMLLPISPYGWHKLIAEKICEEFTYIYGVPVAIVRPFSVFGPGLKKQLIWDLYQKINKAKPGDVIELWGTGKESRDFIYVHSLADALNCIVQKGQFKADKYNIAGGMETYIDELAAFFVQNVDKPVQIKFNQQIRTGDPQNWKADISKIEALGFASSISWQDGLKETIKWLKGFE